MRDSNQTVRNFEYAIGVGDLVVAAAARQALGTDLSPADSALVEKLERQFRKYEEIEANHGSGSLLNLQISTVSRLAKLGHIEKSRVDAAIRYTASTAT